MKEEFCGETARNGFSESVAADCAELRDIAAYFDSLGKHDNAHFMRHMADCHWAMFIATLRATPEESSAVPPNVPFSGARNDD